MKNILKQESSFNASGFFLVFVTFFCIWMSVCEISIPFSEHKQGRIVFAVKLVGFLLEKDVSLLL